MRNEYSTSRKGSLPTPDHLASFAAAGGQQPTFAFTSPSGSGSAPATPQREHAFASAAFGPSIVFSDGVVANLPAFVHLILNRKLWGSASVSVQEIVFESLARCVLHFIFSFWTPQLTARTAHAPHTTIGWWRTTNKRRSTSCGSGRPA
jgi:hypothetical protein